MRRLSALVLLIAAPASAQNGGGPDDAAARRPLVGMMSPMSGSAGQCRSAPGSDFTVLRTLWREVEPQRDRMDWAWMDARVRQARNEGVRFQLEVHAGINSPDWVGAESLTVEGRRVPAPWDDDLLDELVELQTEIARRYPDAYTQYVSGYWKQEMFLADALRKPAGWAARLARHTTVQANAIHAANPSALVGIMVAPPGGKDNVPLVINWARSRPWAVIQSNALGGKAEPSIAWVKQIIEHGAAGGSTGWEAVDVVSAPRFIGPRGSIDDAVLQAATVGQRASPKFYRWLRFPLDRTPQPIPQLKTLLDELLK